MEGIANITDLLEGMKIDIDQVNEVDEDDHSDDGLGGRPSGVQQQ